MEKDNPLMTQDAHYICMGSEWRLLRKIVYLIRNYNFVEVAALILSIESAQYFFVAMALQLGLYIIEIFYRLSSSCPCPTSWSSSAAP